MLQTAHQYLKTYPISRVIGLGTQQNLRLRKYDCVLWIVEHDRPDAAPACIHSELLETGFIIETQLLKSTIQQISPSDTLLELFWKLSEARELVLSCDIEEMGKQHPPIPNYADSSLGMQIANKLLDVIDQRTKLYCNTTRSKAWLEKYPSKVEKHAKVTNPRDTLIKWKKVLGANLATYD